MFVIFHVKSCEIHKFLFKIHFFLVLRFYCIDKVIIVFNFNYFKLNYLETSLTRKI